MQHIMASDGTVILPGAMLHAVHGPHAGSHWRLEGLHHNGTHHVLRCSRLVRGSMRVRMDHHPRVFDLDVVELSAWWRISRDDVMRCWHRIDDGLIMGVLALVPLAAFEAFHGGEHARALIMSLIGGE